MKIRLQLYIVLIINLLFYVDAMACALQWSCAFSIDDSYVPKPTKQKLDTFLDNEFGKGQWILDDPKQLQIVLTSPQNIETEIYPITITTKRNDFSRIHIYLEILVGYSGNEWRSYLHTEQSHGFRNVNLLLMRQKVMDYSMKDQNFSKISIRIRVPLSHIRIIVAAVEENDKRKQVIVLKSELISYPLAACGRSYIVDSKEQANVLNPINKNYCDKYFLAP